MPTLDFLRSTPTTTLKPHTRVIGGIGRVGDSPFVCNCDHGWAAHKTIAKRKRVQTLHGRILGAALGADIQTLDDVMRDPDTGGAHKPQSQADRPMSTLANPQDSSMHKAPPHRQNTPTDMSLPTIKSAPLSAGHASGKSGQHVYSRVDRPAFRGDQPISTIINYYTMDSHGNTRNKYCNRLLSTKQSGSHQYEGRPCTLALRNSTLFDYPVDPHA